MTDFSSLPPPPKGQTGMTVDQFKNLPPPPPGQVGLDPNKFASTTSLNGFEQLDAHKQAQAKDVFNPFPVKNNNTQSPIDTIKSQAASGIDQIKKGLSDIGGGHSSPIQGAEAGLGIESGLASIATSPLAPLFTPVKKVIDATANVIGSNKAVQDFANSDAGKTTSRVAEDVANAGNVAGTIAGGDQAVKQTPTALGYLDKGMSTVKDLFTKKTAPEPPNTGAIIDSYNKAIKPSVAGKTGPGQLEAYNNSVVHAVKTVADNKLNLSFEDANGNKVTGELPQSRAEFADAISQTKQVIFSQYDALAKKASGQGVEVSLGKAGDALEGVINSESLKLTNPEAIKYAQAVKERLHSIDPTTGQPTADYKTVTPDVAQEAISSWNASLKAFYKNPSYESASRAAIDAGVVNALRQALDETINNATGENYQGVKHQYGALSTVEKDVNKAAMAQAKQTGSNASGLGKYIDVFSGGDILSGLLSLNPAMFTKGVAQMGISHLFQILNSPDRAVQTMFKHVSKP